MKKINTIVLSLTTLAIVSVGCAFTESKAPSAESEVVSVQEAKEKQRAYLFMTDGHSSAPFAGSIDDLVVSAPKREDRGNPLENLEVSFQINPESFIVCSGEKLTAKIKTLGLFIGENDEKITFRSTEVSTIGVDWYQLNGIMSIMGVEKEMKFFVSGIRDPKESGSSLLILEGQVNLLDWGIDYDKIVDGESNENPTKWMHLNMKIKMP